MALFLFQGFDREGAGELRALTRPDHLVFARSLGGMIKLAGPMLSADGTGRVIGSLFVVDAPGEEALAGIFARDPYALAGVFERVAITPFRAVLGEWVPSGEMS